MTKKTYNSSDIKRLAEQASKNLLEVANNAQKIATRLHRDQSNGFPQRSGDGGGRAAPNDDGSVSGPTPAMAQQADAIEILASRMMKALVAAEVEARTAVVCARAAWGLSHEVAQQLSEAETPKGARCVNCDEWVPGVGEHRIKAGRCPACYIYRLRHEGFDRRIEVADELE